MHSRTQNAQPAKDALERARAQKPHLGHRLQMATVAESEQLVLFLERGGGLVSNHPGLKAHEWDLSCPVSKTRFYVTYRCKHCCVQLRRTIPGSTHYGLPMLGRLGSVYVFDKKRPTCPPTKDPDHG